MLAKCVCEPQAMFALAKKQHALWLMQAANKMIVKRTNSLVALLANPAHCFQNFSLCKAEQWEWPAVQCSIHQKKIWDLVEIWQPCDVVFSFCSFVHSCSCRHMKPFI